MRLAHWESRSTGWLAPRSGCVLGCRGRAMTYHTDAELLRVHLEDRLAVLTLVVAIDGLCFGLRPAPRASHSRRCCPDRRDELGWKKKGEQWGDWNLWGYSSVAARQLREVTC